MSVVLNRFFLHFVLLYSFVEKCCKQVGNAKRKLSRQFYVYARLTLENIRYYNFRWVNRFVCQNATSRACSVQLKIHWCCFRTRIYISCNAFHHFYLSDDIFFIFIILLFQKYESELSVVRDCVAKCQERGKNAYLQERVINNSIYKSNIFIPLPIPLPLPLHTQSFCSMINANQSLYHQMLRLL